jgi:hypothetical protein
MYMRILLGDQTQHLPPCPKPMQGWKEQMHRLTVLGLGWVFSGEKPEDFSEA